MTIWLTFVCALLYVHCDIYFSQETTHKFCFDSLHNVQQWELGGEGGEGGEGIGCRSMFQRIAQNRCMNDDSLTSTACTNSQIIHYNLRNPAEIMEWILWQYDCHRYFICNSIKLSSLHNHFGNTKPMSHRMQSPIYYWLADVHYIIDLKIPLNINET